MPRWFAMSAQFLTDPKIERLGEKHGPAAVSVVVALLGQAMLQEKGGAAERTFRTLANESFTDRDTVQSIVKDAADIGLLTIEGQDDMGVTVDFPAWSRHQAAFRKAKSRGVRKAASQANVADGHGPSQNVTNKTRQNKTEQDKTKQDRKTTAAATRKGLSKKVLKKDWNEWIEDFHSVTGRVSISGSLAAQRAFAARRNEGHTLEDLKAATVGCHSDAWRVEKGRDTPDIILRATEVEGYISQARDVRKSTGSPGMDNARRLADRIKAKQEARAAA